MNRNLPYLRIVEWSDEDGCFIGSCPELFYGGCHGNDAQTVFNQLCELIEETVALYERDGKPLPKPLSSRDFVSRLLKTA